MLLAGGTRLAPGDSPPPPPLFRQILKSISGEEREGKRAQKATHHATVLQTLMVD